MEELGLVGSARYVQQHASDRIVAMLNLDINAYGNTVVFGPSERPDNAALRRAFVQTCAAEDIACVGFPQMPPGDDRSFVKAGIPTISLGIVPAVEAHQLWLMMNAGPNAGLAQGTDAGHPAHDSHGGGHVGEGGRGDDGADASFRAVARAQRVAALRWSG